MNEEWLPVVGYENCYEVSDQGRVRSLTRRVADSRGYEKTIKGKIKKQTLDGTYLISGFCKNNQKEIKYTHRVVCEAFLGPLPKGLCTRHLDGNSTNNCLSNLEYGSYSENQLDKITHGSMPRGTSHYGAKLTEEDVVAIRTSSQTQYQLAQRFEVNQSTIWEIIHCKIWRHV